MNFAGKKILVVDDEMANLSFFEMLLSKHGFIVEKAKDGAEAVEKVKRFLPDLVLLDNIMPVMSGMEAAKLLKNDKEYRKIPIIMLTAMGTREDIENGFRHGVDDYITKPEIASKIIGRIKGVLQKKENTGGNA